MSLGRTSGSSGGLVGQWGEGEGMLLGQAAKISSVRVRGMKIVQSQSWGERWGFPSPRAAL